MPAVFGDVNENSNMSLTAPAGTTFVAVDFASYGTPSGYVQGACHASSSQSVVESYVIGQTGTVTIPATNAVFGDPCTGTPKKLQVIARYSPANSSISFSSIRSNFYNYTNSAGFNYGTNDANLYNLNYYRGKRYNRQNVTGGFSSTYAFPSGAITFDHFYDSNGNCACDCVCDCVCACSTDSGCFPGDAMVKMADGSLKRIDQIKIGDVVSGGYGFKNNVIAYHKIKIGNQPLFNINGKHRTTREHRHWTTEGWAAIDKEAGKTEFTHLITIDNDGATENRKNIKFTKTPISYLKIGSVLINEQGLEEPIEQVKTDWRPDPEMYVYTLVLDGSHSHIVDGFIATGWARDDDFDYTTWTILKETNYDKNHSSNTVTCNFCALESA